MSKKRNSRYQSREIRIGPVRVGGKHPIVIQSMLTTPLYDTNACLKQVESLVASGCRIIRVAIISKKDLTNLENIKKFVEVNFPNIALVADIHHHPELANSLVGRVDKIRINPGNYLGNPKREWDQKNLEAVKTKTINSFRQFLKLCETTNTAIRIGVNQGSLSDRMYYQYGNTAEGMVASAAEFIEVCVQENFKNVVISLKSSDAGTMIKSNRLLIRECIKKGVSYPIHLGVTEAGNGVSGRIKSIYGISTLLQEGIGDTIRVSLTEDPKNEIPVCHSIIKHASNNKLLEELAEDKEGVIVIHSSDEPSAKTKTRGRVLTANNASQNTFQDFQSREEISCQNVTKELDEKDLDNCSHVVIWVLSEKHAIDNAVFLNKNLSRPIIVLKIQNDLVDKNDFLTSITNATMPLLTGNFVNGIWINSQVHGLNYCDKVAIELMQLAGKIALQPNYISCPGCSRTLFDLEKITNEIKEKTRHFGPLKIGVMGCVINGIGEMGDCDYGYVGAGKGKINLYKKNELVSSGIDEAHAMDELLSIIDELN